MSRRRFRGVVISLSFAGGIGLAARVGWAQDPPPEPPPESPPAAFVAPPPGYEPPTQYAQGAPPAPVAAEAAPTFLTLDRMDASTRLGIQVGWDKIDQNNLSDGFFMRYELYGQYVFPGYAAGLYGHLPISHVFAFNGPDASGIGNVELGGFFMPTHNQDLILRAGLSLATGSGNGDDGVLPNVVTTYERLTDAVLILPDYTTLRLSASTLQQRDILFFRADVGFDLAVDKPSNATTSVYFRGNLALGVRAPGVDVTLELANWAQVNGNVNGGGGVERRFVHTAGFSLRTQGEHQFHLGTVFPLDDALRGELWILSVGYQRAVTM